MTSPSKTKRGSLWPKRPRAPMNWQNSFAFQAPKKAGQKGEQEDKSLESKLKELRKTRLEENEKEFRSMVSTVYARPASESGQRVDGHTPAIIDLARDRLRAILESTVQGKAREDLLVPFLALVKETEAKFKGTTSGPSASGGSSPSSGRVAGFNQYAYLYRALIIETEIELVKAKIAAGRK